MVARKLAAFLMVGLLVLGMPGLSWAGGSPFPSRSVDLPCADQASASPVPSFGPLLFTSELVKGQEGQAHFQQTFPAGATSLYAFWPYTAAGENSPYKYEWYRDNKLVDQGDAAFEKDWGYAVQAQSGKPLPSGLYRFVVRVKGQIVLSGECVIDGSRSPAFGPISFTYFYNEQTQEPATSSKIFPVGTARIYGYWPYSGVKAGSAFSFEWFQNGTSFATGTGKFPDTAGFSWQSTYKEDHSALAAGTYQLVVTMDSKVILRQQCVIDDQQPVFGPAIFSTGFDESQTAPLGPGRILPQGATRAYAAWRYSGVQANDVFQFDWYHEGQHLNGGEQTFAMDASRAWQWVSQPDDSPLEAGTYQIVITYKGDAVLADQCLVSTAGGPTPTVSPTPAAAAGPSFGPLIFSTGLDETTNKPVNPGHSFPHGPTRVYANWVYEDVPAGDTYEYEWTQDGRRLFTRQAQFSDTTNAVSLWVSYADESALDPGTYRVVIKVDGRAVLSGECRIEPPAQSQ